MSDEISIKTERERLFSLIGELIKWESIDNSDLLDKARLEIARSVARDLDVSVPIGKDAINKFLAEKAPPLMDPFAGGGSIPLEAQRLGLRAYASDLNPVAVLINKALIEIPTKFIGMPPMHPVEKSQDQSTFLKKEWNGTQGLAEDVRYYGNWMRTEAEKRIGYLYPKIKITNELLDKRSDLTYQGLKPGDELTVIAWLWTRTVKCPNPACCVQMPLVRSFLVSTRKGKNVIAEPTIDRTPNPNEISFKVHANNVGNGEGTVSRNGARCIACNTPVSLDYIRLEGRSSRMSSQMMAVVAESKNGRIYLSPTKEQENAAEIGTPIWQPETFLPDKALGFRVQLYGMDKHSKLFTNRQLQTLATYTSLIKEVNQLIHKDVEKSNSQEKTSTRDPFQYSATIATYLGLAVSKSANNICSLVTWSRSRDQSFYVFSRQALAMNWDFADVNPFAFAAGDLNISTATIAKAIRIPSGFTSRFRNQEDVTENRIKKTCGIISTDPPYYDNIGYADLSDFFYVWLRQSLIDIYPDLFVMTLVPKTAELVATPFRFNDDKAKAKSFFEKGLLKAFENFENKFLLKSYPLTIYYAFSAIPRSEGEDENNDSSISLNTPVSTGWETMLEGLLSSGFQVKGTWPIRTERPTRARNTI